ncbi:MAG: helix-turn-helix domain-containing protein [Planctomycetes bacterium]|nr:helix-turn-helix domain-containing protein [Planctomycetota bacterium]
MPQDLPIGHLPPAHTQYTTITEYPPYRQTLPDDVAKLVDRLAVTQVTAIKYTCTARWIIDPHRRVADDMFFHILSGRGAMDVAGRTSRFGPGDLIHWRRGVPHQATTAPDDPIRVISIHYTATIDSAVHLPELLGFPDVFRLGVGHPLEAMSHEACREFAYRPPGWSRGLEALVARMLLSLIRERGEDLHPDLDGRNLRDLQRVLPAVEAMRETIGAPLAIPALARRCAVSEAQFRRIFTRAMGRSPVAHQRQLRLGEACRLLRETADTIEVIAGKVGYAEPAFFANTFRQAMGMTPGKFRERKEV